MQGKKGQGDLAQDATEVVCFTTPESNRAAEDEQRIEANRQRALEPSKTVTTDP